MANNHILCFEGTVEEISALKKYIAGHLDHIKGRLQRRIGIDHLQVRIVIAGDAAFSSVLRDVEIRWPKAFVQAGVFPEMEQIRLGLDW